MKTAFKNTALIAAPLLALLSACGGGGGGTPGAAPAAANTPIYTTNSGSVSAPLTWSAATTRYIVMYAGNLSYGTATTLVQDADGALTTINSSILAGNPNYAVQNISGNAKYAQGRWTKGTVTAFSGSYTFTGASNAAAHTFVRTNLAAIPTSGAAKTCGTPRSTGATYAGGTFITDNTTVGVTTITGGTITFSGAGAQAQLTLTTAAGGSVGSLPVSGTVVTPTDFIVSGSFLSSSTSTGALITLGDGGAGVIVMGVAYRVTMANGAIYQGILSMDCS